MPGSGSPAGRPGPPLLIGTSGWSFDAWKTGWYRGIPRRRWLAHAASRLTALEVNGTFYCRPSPATLARWQSETPAGFPFAVKGHRFLTHYLRLKGAEASLELQKQYMAPLGPRLAAVLWQLPERQAKDAERLAGFAAALSLWPETRHVMEFRNATWFDAETEAILARHGIANCISDASAWPRFDAVTTDLVYVRLHGHDRTYASRYSAEDLAPWARRIRRWQAAGRTVHVYFDNDQEGAAPFDAERLLGMLGRAPAASLAEAGLRSAR